MGKAAKTNTAAKQSTAAEIVEYLEVFVFAVAVVVLLLTFCFRLCQVDGPSMNNTLAHGEQLLISDTFYTPKRGDVIVFHLTDSDVEYYNKPIVKRVIATGGQFVKIDYQQNLVFVSDDTVFDEAERLDESAYAFFGGYNGTWREAVFGEEPEVFAVPEGHLFVMGDNRNNSADSRNEHIGFVPEDAVLGRVICRVLPFSAFGKIE